MYYRSQGYRYPRDMRIPINYSGNAFTSSSAESEESLIIEQKDSNNSTDSAAYDSTTIEQAENLEETPSADEESPIIDEPKASKASILGSLTSSSIFSKIGGEELLILALVFLLSDNDTENDIIWLLLILLFIK